MKNVCCLTFGGAKPANCFAIGQIQNQHNNQSQKHWDAAVLTKSSVASGFGFDLKRTGSQTSRHRDETAAADL